MQAELLSLNQTLVKALDSTDIYKVGLLSSYDLQRNTGLKIPEISEPWFVSSGETVQVVEMEKGEPYVNRSLRDGYIRPVLWLRYDYMTQALNTKYLLGSYLFTPIPRLNLLICDTYVGGRQFNADEVFDALKSWELTEVRSETRISKVSSYDVSRYEFAENNGGDDGDSEYCSLRPMLVMKKKKYQSGAKYNFYGHYFTAIADNVLLSDYSFGLVEKAKARSYLLNWIRRVIDTKSEVSRVTGEAYFCISCVRDIEKPFTDEEICNSMAHLTQSVKDFVTEEFEKVSAEQNTKAVVSYTHMNILPPEIYSDVMKKDFVIVQHKVKCCMNGKQRSVGITFEGEAGDHGDFLLRKKRVQAEQSINDLKQKALLKLQKRAVSCPACKRKVNATGLSCPLCSCSLLSKTMLKQLERLEKSKAQLETELEQYYGLHLGLFFLVKVNYICS